MSSTLQSHALPCSERRSLVFSASTTKVGVTGERGKRGTNQFVYAQLPLFKDTSCMDTVNRYCQEIKVHKGETRGVGPEASHQP